MFNKINSWENLNESTNGRHTIEGPDGKKQKITYKVQDSESYMIKFKRSANLITNGQLTDSGRKRLTEIHNSQAGLVETFGKLDDIFFKDKFILYTVKTDTENTEKLQIKIVNRNIAPSITSNLNFVSAVGLSNVQPGSELDSNVKDAVNRVNSDDVDEDPAEEVDVKQKGNPNLSEFGGRRFRYDMRTNNKRYLMTFTDDGHLEADVMDNSKPDGTISLVDGKIMWETAEDDNVSAEKWAKLSNMSLYVDCEITNTKDKENLTKVLTDKAYAEKILSEYEEKYGSADINEENIKNMLYNRDGTKIFPEEKGEGTSSSSTSTTSKTPDVVYDPGEGKGYTTVETTGISKNNPAQ
jgi:hypothetical protein